MRRRVSLPLLVLLSILLLPVFPAAAQLLEWVDEQGTTHYAADLDRVPERFRGVVRLVPSPSPAAAPAAATPEATGLTRLAFTPGSPILVQARINGAGPVTLVLDTGAERTLVSPATLRAVGIVLEAGRPARLTGVTGTVDAIVVQVATLEVGNARVGPVAVIAHDAGLGPVAGLLGRDFLDRFRVVIDSQAGVVTLAPP